MDRYTLSLLIPILSIIFVVGVPVVGLVTHFVLRPLVRDITEAIRAGTGATSPEVERRLAELEESQALMSRRLDRVLEAERFREKLEANAAKES